MNYGNPLIKLESFGQSIWIDFIRRVNKFIQAYDQLMAVLREKRETALKELMNPASSRIMRTVRLKYAA